MKDGVRVVRWVAGLALAYAAVAPALFAEEPAKTLPTLLIKGEVVSVDTNDPAAVLLKVKDRYGFETPIYLGQDTKLTQGDQAMTVVNLTAGTAVEVEYNFDINTAKRHAVSVKKSMQASAAASTAPAAATSAAPAQPAAATSNAAPEAAAQPAATPAPAASAPTQPASASPQAAVSAPQPPAGTKTQ